jgi:hypothetical protein
MHADMPQNLQSAGEVQTKARPRGGSRKGRPNKTTASVKDAIAQVAQGLGGADGMLKWAQSDATNERLFWSNIYPKLLPLQLTGENGGPLQISWPVPKSRVEN